MVPTPGSTRRRILDATLLTLVERGHAGTTTLAVQRRAGVSRGALLHYFPTRADLLVAAVSDVAEAQVRVLRHAAGHLP
ncbi:MAG: TetR/AcrR family transcriptional regulator, partial [Actinomycetes bacterium]